MICIGIQSRVISGSSAYFIIFASKIIVKLMDLWNSAHFDIYLCISMQYFTICITIYFIIHGRKNSMSISYNVHMVMTCTYLHKCAPLFLCGNHQKSLCQIQVYTFYSPTSSSLKFSIISARSIFPAITATLMEIYFNDFNNGLRIIYIIW